MIRTSAPGKLMLFGEHGVVYGGACIVTAVDIRYTVELSEIRERKAVIQTAEATHEVGLDQIAAAPYEKNTAFVLSAVKTFYKRHGISQRGVRISTDGPALSYGLGSSSAITVATIHALLNYFGHKPSQREVFELAYEAVLDVQGVASGFDVASAVFGGTIYYANKGAVIEPIESLQMPLILAYTGSKVPTTNYIKSVAELRQRQGNLIDGIFDLMNAIAAQAKTHIQKNNWRAAGELANINQGLLDALGVNTVPLMSPIFAAREGGAWGAKLSGAGGGDCMFAIAAEEQRKQVADAINRSGAKVLSLPLNVEGVKLIQETV